MLGRQARTRADLHLKAQGNGPAQARRNHGPRAGAQGHGLVVRHGGAQVHPGGPHRLIGRQGQALGVRQAEDGDLRRHGVASFRENSIF